MDAVASFSESGVAILQGQLSAAELRDLDGAFASMSSGEAAARHFRFSSELRDLLAGQRTLSDLAAKLGDAPVTLCRAIAFDKTPETNWFVPWHQDRAIAVQERSEVEGYDRWTFKDGHHHVEPPVVLLEGMVTLRVHLDDCGETNGPLEVAPGSHSAGRLERLDIEKLVADSDRQVCLAARGDVLAMRPLIVHRSQRALHPRHRRVLHLEYSTRFLPGNLKWVL